MKKCPNCGAIISDDSLFCGKCGCLLNKQQIKTPAGEQMNNNEDLLENNERNVRKYYVVAGGVVVLLVALGFYLFKSHGRQAGNQNMLDSLSDTISTMEMQDSVEVTEELSANDILKRHPGFQLLCSVSGDFDGDGKEETLYAINPKSDEGPHIEYVYFSKRNFLLLRFRRMVFMYLIVNLKMQETWMGMEAMKSHFILLDIRPVGMITISGHIKMGNG